MVEAVSKVALIANAALAVGLLIAYVVLTALHDDGTAILGLLSGQLAAVSVAKGADAATSRPGP